MDRNRRARHLHQRQDAFLHPCPARGRKKNERRAQFDRPQHAGDNRLAGRHAKRSCHEIEVLGGGYDGQAVELAFAHQNRVILLRCSLGVFQAVDVTALVAEFERVLRHGRHGNRGVVSAVEQVSQPLLARHPPMIAGTGHDELVRLQVFVKYHLTGLRARDPLPVGDLPLGGQKAPDLGANKIVNPVHWMKTPRRSKHVGRDPKPGSGRLKHTRNACY